ncbi:MAG: glycoside hydrolase family 95 protein [Ignavibacteriales bacterium]|nr:glycoside hydrolase family 95 protein [Ignavibacteriales bacterium]
MNYSIKFILSLIVISFLSCTNSSDQEINSDMKLWYDKPAEEWVEALPIGNGRLGAMVFGGIENELIQLNEESLWAGTKINANNPEASKNLKKIQNLLLDGKNTEAKKLAVKYLLGTPPRIRSYQTLGELNLNFNFSSDSIENYRRELNLPSGISSVTFKQNRVKFRREAFISAVDNIIAVNITASENSVLNFSINLNREKDAVIQTDGNNSLFMTGQINDNDTIPCGPAGAHMKFASKLKVINKDGNLSSDGSTISVSNASEATIYLTAATDYNIDSLNFERSINPVEICNNIFEKINSKSYTEIKNDHIKEHSSIFNRVELNLGDSLLSKLPTDQRLQRIINGEKDPELISIFFQYGRYLLMNSSRSPGVLPANLQGVWNKDFGAPWNSDFHTNINLQMNYWPAEMCNLSETIIPLTNFFDKIQEPGKTTAKEMYNAKGWMMHHVTDPFGYTAINGGIQWGTSPLAGAWMTLSFWRHYEFTQDLDYLKNSAYPLMKGACEFILDFLIEDKNGYLVTAPSMSPENSYINPQDGTSNQITYAPTMDIQIINELFNAAIKSANILKTDADLVSQMQNTLKRLPPVRVGKDSTIMEWVEDYQEVEPGHRHMSHLYGLHPGTQITPKTPELFEAAKMTLKKRLANGGGHTGWSRAWMINFYARLLDAENAYFHLSELFKKSVLPNLFDTHPPFQIDGNFGATSGIAEMLLQSHNDEINILPALPTEWQNGFVKGLKAQGNFIIDIAWNNGKLTEVKIKSNSGGECNLKYKEFSTQLVTSAGEEYLVGNNLK